MVAREAGAPMELAAEAPQDHRVEYCGSGSECAALMSCTQNQLRKWTMEVRVKVQLELKGGLLCDKMGYGKTCCAIALIAATRRRGKVEAPRSRATLVLAPANLVVQWHNEIRKFTGDALTVRKLSNITTLRNLSLQELLDADVVLASYTLFTSKPYEERRAELLPHFRDAPCEGALRGDVACGCRACAAGWERR